MNKSLKFFAGGYVLLAVLMVLFGKSLGGYPSLLFLAGLLVCANGVGDAYRKNGTEGN